MNLPRESAAELGLGEAGSRRWIRWALCFGAWWVAEAFILSQNHFYRISAGQPPLEPMRVLLGLSSSSLWALLTPSILTLARLLPLNRGGWIRSLGAHALLALAYNAADVMYDKALASSLGIIPNSPLVARFFGEAVTNVFSYAVVSAIGHALSYHRLYVERRLRESELEAQLLQARLQALEMQLHPHFLFNALHTVAALIRTRQYPEAIRTLAGFGDLLRSMLHREDTQIVPLRQELEFIEKYLRIEQIRFQDRLRTQIDVEPEALGAMVPYLILQPLVENAIRHGIEANEGAGELAITVRREADRLWMQVRNSGAGPGDTAAPKETHGIGLSNTRERLRHLYGEGHHFELTRAEAGGALARMSIPLQRSAAEARP